MQQRGSLNVVTYTQWPTMTAQNHLRVLAGTSARVTGHASVPLAQARLIVTSPTNETELQATVDATGRQLRIPADPDLFWQISESGVFRFELTDTEGLSHAGDTFEISVVPDQKPVIILEQPTAHALVTTNASLPVRGVVKDDLAVRSIDLRYGRGDQAD